MNTTTENARWVRARGRSLAVAAVCGALALFGGMGCEDDGDDDNGNANQAKQNTASAQDQPPAGDNNPLVGSWAMYEGDSAQGRPGFYLHLLPDGSYYISDTRDGGAHMTGTYQVSGDALTGPFHNPGVGDGRIDAVLVNGLLDLDFIEYWHTPHKVIPYTCQKI